jgi:hypothetical protein
MREKEQLSKMLTEASVAASALMLFMCLLEPRRTTPTAAQTINAG